MQVYGDAQTVAPVQLRPPHWPQCAATLVPVAVADELVAVVDTLVVLLDSVVAVFVGNGVPAAAARSFCTLSYAGLVVRFDQYRHASPCPENVLGIQLYLSSKSHTVIPTHLLTARQALTTEP